MADRNKDRLERLARLADQLDRASESLPGDTDQQNLPTSDDDLSPQELEELSRVREALDFIHSVCPAYDDPGNQATPTIPAAGETPTGQRDTVWNQVETYPGAAESEPPGPSRLGRFQLKTQLGEGGFARVYLAYDPQLNRPVALKLLRESLFFSDEVKHRFEREAQAAAILQHLGIVPVFESGMIDGQRYIASAYCPGITLEQWLQQQEGRPLPTRLVARMITQLADALQHAHDRGIVHRDLKPANILVETETTVDAEADEWSTLPQRLRIADFGLARHATTTNQMQTSEGAIVGTPAYMSPEQAAGSTEIDGRSDIYSLGVLFYELLTGSVPILRDNNLDTLQAVRREEPGNPGKLRSGLPRDLEAICMKCLQKAPDQRYPSAYDVAAELNHWLAGEPVAARHASFVERSWKWVRRNPGFTTAFAVITAALLFALFQWRSAVHENRRAERNLALGQQVIDQMVNRVADDRTLPSGLRLELAERAAKFQEQLLVESPQNVMIARQSVRAYNRLARILFDLSEHEVALKMIDQAIEIGQAMPDNEKVKPLLQSALQIKAGLLTRLNRIDESLEVVDQAEASQSEDPFQQSSSQFSRGMAYLEKGELAKAVAEFEASQEAIRDYQGELVHANKFSRINFYWGRALMKDGQFNQAMKHTETAREYLEPILSSGHGFQTILEEMARCDLQSAEILGLQAEQPESELDLQQQESCRARAAENLEQALARFEQLVNRNDRVDRLFGQYAYVYTLLINLEVDRKDLDAAAELAEDFTELAARVPEDNVHREEIASNLIEQWWLIHGAMLQAGESGDAEEVAEFAVECLHQWLDAYPSSKALQQWQQQIEGQPRESRAEDPADGSIQN